MPSGALIGGIDSYICKAVLASILMNAAMYKIFNVLGSDYKSLSSMVGKATNLMVCLSFPSTTIKSIWHRSRLENWERLVDFISLNASPCILSNFIIEQNKERTLVEY